MFRRCGHKVHAAHWGYDGSLKVHVQTNTRTLNKHRGLPQMSAVPTRPTPSEFLAVQLPLRWTGSIRSAAGEVTADPSHDHHASTVNVHIRHASIAGGLPFTSYMPDPAR
jgi:hypothetical protein